jgi:hypothetical protein
MTALFDLVVVVLLAGAEEQVGRVATTWVIASMADL